MQLFISHILHFDHFDEMVRFRVLADTANKVYKL